MGYLQKSLSEGETIRYVGRRHGIYYLVNVTMIFLGLSLISICPPGGVTDNCWALGIVLVFLGVICLPINWLINRTTELVITNRKVMGKWGIIGRTAIEQNLEKVDSVQVEQSILGRMLDYGTIYVHGSGTSTTPIELIADPLTFRRQVANAVEALRSGGKNQ